MDGVVKFVNEEMYLFAVETENGFTVFEFMETDYVEIGDVITGVLESTTCSSIINHSRGEELEVYVRDFVTTLEAAEALVVYCEWTVSMGFHILHALSLCAIQTTCSFADLQRACCRES